MSRDVDLSRLQKWIGKAKEIGEPPAPAAQTSRGRSGADDRDALVQFNIKVKAAVKKRAKQLATRDDITLTVLVARMVDLYEKEYGALTDTAGKRR